MVKNKVALSFVGFWFALSAWGSENALEQAISQGQWNEAAQISYEVLRKNPSSADAKLKGAYALFQRGFSNSALVFLRKLNASDWKHLPRDQEKIIEIIALYQKSVPLNILPSRLEQLNPETASEYLRDEIRFAKARASFEKREYKVARDYLNGIALSSRFYVQARYLLGSIALDEGNDGLAQTEFSKIFENSVFTESTELWRDVGDASLGNWNVAVKVALDPFTVSENTRVGELAVLALARLYYKKKDFKSALSQYAKISPQSPFHTRAQLESIWTILGMNDHEKAQALAKELSQSLAEKGDGHSFEAVEAMPLRALILADAKRSEEARAEIQSFLKLYEASKRLNPPADFLRNDIKQNQNIAKLNHYQDGLKKEIEALSREQTQMFPVYGMLREDLAQLLHQARRLTEKTEEEQIAQRRKDMERLYAQAKLILAETWLEDREKLRIEFRGKQNLSLEDQKQHDERLVQLLEKAIGEVQDFIGKDRGKENARLTFRSVELLWELGSARGILFQSSKDKKDEELSDSLHAKALKLAESISDHPKALFFSGFAQLDLGKEQVGIQTLRQYVQKYPREENVPDAYRILADVEFDANRFEAAEQLYKRIFDFQDSPIAGYAYYKIGWSAYNRKDFARALLALEKAVFSALSSGDEERVLSLKREASHDLVALYAEVGDYKRAYEYFSRFPAKDLSDWIQALADEYDRTGQFEKSIELYARLIVSEPSDSRNLKRQASIVNGSYKLRRWPQVVEAAKDLTKSFSSKLKNLENEESKDAEVILRAAVFDQQFELKKVYTEEAADRVSTLDEIYLDVYGDLDVGQEPLYRHAHFLLERKKIASSLEAFRTHWKRFAPLLKEPVKEESLRNLIHVLEESEKSGTVGITQELVDTTLEYDRLYPSTEYTRPVRYLRSALYFKTKHFEDGIEESQKLFDANPSDDIGKRTFNNMRVALYDKKDWEAVFNWAEAYLSRDEKALSAIKNYISDLKAIREESLFLLASQASDPEKGAELFLKVNQNRDRALYNAFINLEKSGKKIQALSVADELAKEFPAYEGLSSIAGVRAALYQEVGDYERAVPLLKEFLAKPSRETGTEVLAQAKKNLNLMEQAIAAVPVQRSVSSTSTHPAFNLESKLLSEHQSFERQPIPQKGELAARIQAGAQKLESIVKAFTDVASDKKTPNFYAFETYCMLPFSYRSYATAVRGLAGTLGLAANEVEELKKELEKIAIPIDAKASEFASDCIQKSMTSEHDGPYFRKILENWGWASDGELKKQVAIVLDGLSKGMPWLDDVDLLGFKTEKEIFDFHFKKKPTIESWLALAQLRWNLGRIGLARLTLVDAISKKQSSGPILNHFTIAEQKLGQQTEPSVLVSRFENAANEGSRAAWANLAFYHLRAARIERGIAALQKAQGKDVFEKVVEFEKQVKELISYFKEKK